MIERPRVKPHVAIVLVSPGNVLVKGPGLFVRYTGDAVPVLLDVAKLLDGSRTRDAIVRESGHATEDVADVIEALVADRVLEDAAEEEKLALSPAQRARLDPQLQLFSHLSSTPSIHQGRLRDARVAVLGGGATAEALARLIESSGVGKVERKGIEDPLRVVADDLRPLVRGRDHAVLALDAPYRIAFLAMNEAALAERTPWTAVMLDDLDASVGPTVFPGESACWRCYDVRTIGAHPNMERLLAYQARAPPPTRPLGLPGFAEAAAAFAAQAVTLTVSRAVPPPLAGRVLRISLLDMRAERHRVLRLPRCPACSPSDVPDVDRYALSRVDLP